METENRQENLEFLENLLEVKKSEDLLLIKNYAMDSSREAIVIIGLDGALAFANNAFAEICETWPQRNNILYECFGHAAGERIQQVVLSTGVFDDEVSVPRKDKVHIFHIVANLVADNAGKPIGVMVMCSDITKQKAAENLVREKEQQLVQSAKLASLGEMATGIAHELNNPLAAIQGYAQLIKKYSDNERITSQTEKILKASLRMQAIINHLRVFGRESSDDSFRNLQINTPIRDSFILLDGQLQNNHIAYALDLDDRLPPVWGDHNQLESVFQNLIVNSRDAFLTFKEQRNRRITIKTHQQDDQICVEYIDNAGGMPDRVVERLFEPFFTTKPEGVGTGLGMSILYGIVAQHNGVIAVKTKLGVGTTFSLTFPISNRANIVTAPADKPSKTEKKNSAILILDDEEDLCEILHEYLSDDFVPYRASSPTDLQEQLEKRSYSALITDINMPGHDIHQVISAFQNANPKAKIIFMSGFHHETKSLEELVGKGKPGFLAKPFGSQDDITRYIRGILKEK